MTTRERVCLTVLRDAGAPITYRPIWEAWKSTPEPLGSREALFHVLRRLEARGWIAVSESDRGLTLRELTPEGAAALDATAASPP